MKLADIRISCPDGLPQNTEILIDGKKMTNVTKLQLSFGPDEQLQVTLTMFAALHFDGTLVDRTFTTLTEREEIDNEKR